MAARDSATRAGREAKRGQVHLFAGSGTAARAEHELQAEFLGTLFNPGLRPVRLPALHTAADRVQVRFGLRTVHHSRPVSRARDRPFSQQAMLLGLIDGVGPALIVVAA